MKYYQNNNTTKYSASSDTGKIIQNKAIELQDNRPASILQRKKNNTGLPDNLKSGIENLSGHSMDDVKVHYNSNKPAQLNAHAYAQGTDIHVASGQEKHLAHEAWHVVQQKQGRVKPTLQMRGKVNVNDDKVLENEADVMGAKALQMKIFEEKQKNRQLKTINTANIQPKWISNKGPLLKWDIPIKGVRWYYNQSNHKMFYIIEQGGDRFSLYAGKENARTHGQWLELGATPLLNASANVIDEEDVFTDSDSDSEDPTHEGVRLMQKDKKNDLAEFDRLRFGRKKIYEDKLTHFGDKSKIPSKHKQTEGKLIEAWIKKQILEKVTKKMNVIQGDLNNVTVRAHEETGQSVEIIMEWIPTVRQFKIVVFGESPLLKEKLKAAILELRTNFPSWRITAKMGDPVARLDHDNMHGK
ncbi:eCIS core domain-containing protein [Flavobacterium salmonis]|uniref:eCIS core domain-containing protein n=1 Tax=Flavobacterium salmonis TaxID=2654844 RepID=A0A6V6ZBV9_9FLAO|nr:DUF4157 domain-containing protein [Flavobacterium salmonis]CAD0009125.1 hypothetical protein FLAT13_04760 [Flavobacterium salmonis]